MRGGEIAVGILLILDALLHILVVQVELADAMVGAKARVVIGHDARERRLLAFGVLLVIFFLLRQVFLNLLYVLISLGRWREYAGNVQRTELRVLLGLLFLNLREQFEILDGIVDAGRCQHRVELAAIGRCIVLGENGFNDLGLGHTFTRLGRILAFGLEVIHVKAQDVAILDGVGDGVLMQATLEEVVGRAVTGLLTFDLLVAGVLLEDGCAGKAKKLGVGEELLDGFVVVAKL